MQGHTRSLNKASFLDVLSQNLLVVDGAMGTQLYERGILFTVNYEELNLSRPEVVRKIHEEYVRAGAQVLETNTFGANPARLSRHGLEDKIREINVRGVSLAREAAQSSNTPVFVTGAMGPTGLMFTAPEELSQAEIARISDGFRCQADALAEGGADALFVETMRQPFELRLAIEAAKKTNLPIIASASFDEVGTMADGTPPQQIAQSLVEWGADIIGANCGEGPKLLFEIAERMLESLQIHGMSVPLAIVPNAGLPRRIDDRTVYMATPEYFQVYARRMFKLGVRLVGGCCGTTPEHVKKIAASARMAGGAADTDDMKTDSPDERPVSVAPGVVVLASAQKTSFSQLVLGEEAKKKEHFVISVEVNPPPGLSIKKAIDAAKMLVAGGVDVINVADGPRASARMSNLAMVHRIQQEVACEALLHVCCRDRNLLGTIGHLLAAHELAVHNLVVITGDPPKMGDFPDATGVFDLDSVKLLRLIHQLNRGIDPGGKPLGGATHFFCATGAEPAALNYEREMNRLREKKRSGAELVMTQPVYDPGVLDRFLRDAEPLGLPVLVGILPLASYRNAEFLHNEVPGMQVPEDVRRRMQLAGNNGRKEGILIAREMLQAIKNRPSVRGAYIMPPLGRYDAALEVIQGIVR